MQKDKNRQYEILKREVHNFVREFEKNKEWADFGNWLHRLHEQFCKVKCSKLPHSTTLSKRLAQCLNPSLPWGVHATALKLYEHILKQFTNRQQILPLMSMGLFPFFQHSNSQNKMTLLKIFEQYYINDHECLQMIVALTNALLTGLNENSQELARKIYTICQKISKNYGKLWIDGAVWINILKSPKVRLAGFKYFMKSFKDRDRILQNLHQNNQIKEDKFQQKQASKINKIIEDQHLMEEQQVLLTSIYAQKYHQDDHSIRFPNFSSLVINTLSICLETTAENLIKRSALDLLINYLKLSSKSFGERQSIIIVRHMLLLLKTKQYNLTNRVYKYLFGQPNAQGFFMIDIEKKKLQLIILEKAISSLLQINKKGEVKDQGVLLIIDILITDHPSLSQILLRKLSFQIIRFIREFYQLNLLTQKPIKQKLIQFYLNVVCKNKQIFLQSILAQFSVINNLSNTEEQTIQFLNIIDVLKFYFNNLQKIISNEPRTKQRKYSSQNSVEYIENKQKLQEYLIIRSLVIRELILFLHNDQCKNERIAIPTLQLCNQIHLEYQQIYHQIHDNKESDITQVQIQKIEDLLNSTAKHNKKFYSKLITLHPNPKKQMLLPYIEDSSLAIVCINILINGEKVYYDDGKDSFKKSIKSNQKSIKRSFSISDPIILNPEEQQIVFFAIFKLLNCHLFQARALQFIEIFKNKYDTFTKLICEVEPSQWLIYWRKVNGDVSGGVIRMIENLNSRNSYNKHLSSKWILESQSIISKIIDPIYAIMEQKLVEQEQVIEKDLKQQKQNKKWNIKQYSRIYSLILLIFRTTSKNFRKFFFIQKQKYLLPLICFIFDCFKEKDFQTKSKSLQILEFLLIQAEESEQKYLMISLTTKNILQFQEQIIQKKKAIQNSMKLQDQKFEENSFHSRKKNCDLQNLSNIEIQILEYLSKLIESINQISSKTPKYSEQIINVLHHAKIYDIILQGMFLSKTPYIKTLYIDSSKELMEMIAKLDTTKEQISGFMNKILQKLFTMLRNTNINTIQQIIKSRNENMNVTNRDIISKRKKSYQEDDEQVSQNYPKDLYEQQIRNNLNLEQKYAEIIELWNSVKFYIKFAIKNELKQMPIINLLSLILQSFPFSYLKYIVDKQKNNTQYTAEFENLQDQIKNVTGLKKEVLEIFEIIWRKYDKIIIDYIIQQGDPRILIHGSLDPSLVLETFVKSKKLKAVLYQYSTTKLSLPRNTLHYNLQLLLKENQLLYFIYIYLLYCNLSLIKSKKVNLFMESVVELLKVFKITTHIQSKFWILQIIQLIAERVLTNKQIQNIQNWNKIKNEFQQITKELIDELVSIITKSKNFTHKTQIKSGLFNIFTKQQKEQSLFDFVKMFPPTIFELYEKYKQNLKLHRPAHKPQITSEILLEAKQYVIIDDIIESFLFNQFINRSEEDFISYLSICALKTLNRICNNLLIHIYQRDLTKISLIIKQIFMNILPICQNKDPVNQPFNELIAQYLHTVLDQTSLKNQVIKIMRKQIVQIYLANDFFKCTQKTLNHWKAIIDYCTQSYDLLSQLLSKEGLFEGIFTKRSQATRLKIKSFERVCFIIYAGKVDKYENKLRTVLQSLNQVMKQQNPSPALLILILFCIRILLMRLSAVSLNKLFRSVWPSLITLLIQTFKRDRDKNTKNINLQLAALKVIELIHALELQQFMLHKWMFIFDYFGLRIDPMGDIQDNMKQSEVLSAFKIKPFLTNILPNNRFRCKFIPEKQQVDKIKDNIIQRHLIVKQSNVETEEQLKNYVLLLMQYMMDLNEVRVQVSKDQIQNLIEEDFISLDDYIFQIK